MAAHAITISPAAVDRVFELARASLAGLEFIVLSARYGLAIPIDRLVATEDAIASARAELAELEVWGGVVDHRHVH